MKIVVIVVNYNSGPLLRECVDAVLQTTVPVHVCVVDNRSTDDSLEVLRPLAAQRGDLEIFENAQNLGFACANNQVLRSATADFFALINPDCIVDPDALERIIAAMEQDPGVGLASGLIRNPDGSLQKTCRRRFPTPWTAVARSLGLSRLAPHSEWLQDFDHGDQPPMMDGRLEYVEAVSGALMVVRADALKRVGLLDEGYFMHCEDLDWCLRFWQSGYRVGSVAAAEAVHYKGGSGRDLFVNWHLHKGMLRFYRKHYRRRYPLVLMWLVYLGVGARFVFVTLITCGRAVPAFVGYKRQGLPKA